MGRYRSHFKNKKYTMLKDFDILAMPTEAEKELYEEANFEKGVEMMTPTYVRDQNGQKFSLFVSIQEFRQFGPGMYLLFLFLKYATIFFLFISIFSLINTGLLLEGGELSTSDNNFQINMAKATLGNVEEKQLVVIIVFDYIITVLILVGIIFWKERQASYVVECCKEIMLPSYQTIILKEIPELYTEFDMKVYLEERFGEILDIYTVRNFSNDLYHYKEITKIAKEFKEERALLKLKPQRSSIKLAKLFFDFQNYYFKMQKQSSLSKYPKEFAYVTFKSVKNREEILKFYLNTFPSLKGQQREEYVYKTQELQLKACLMQPNGIKWENLHIPKKTKFMWIMIQICLLVLVLLLSIIMIFILFVSESGLSHTEYYGKPKEEILQLNNRDALQSYCLGLSITGFNSDPDCNQFSSQYVKYTILFVALPLVIAFFKFLLTQIMKGLVSIRRHPYEIAKIESQIIIMFAFYFFASGILQFIVFLQIKFENGSTFSFVNIMEPIQKALVGYLEIDSNKIGMTTDYNRQWYTLTSYKLILIALVSFNVSSFGKIAYSFLRKLTCDFYARKQQLQCRMNYWLEGQQMEIQFVYAVAATIICFTLLFGASVPLVYPFTCISLFFLFWSTKFIFINFCAKPLLYSHSMNSLVVKILLLGVVLHGFVSPLYFGAESIHSQSGIRNFLRIPHYGYYIIIMIVPLIYMLYRQKLGNMYEKIKNFYEQANDKGDQFGNHRTKKMSLPSKLCLIQIPKNRKNHIKTYSMHENPEYENILKTLYTINKQERVRATCVLNKQLENLLEKDQAFAEGDQNKLPPRMFYDLCRITQENFSKFQKRVGKEYSKSNNPYKLYVSQLKELQRSSKISQNDPQIYAEMIESQGYMSSSLKSLDISHLKEHLESNKDFGFQYLKKLQNLKRRYKPKANLKQIVQRSDEESISRNRSYDDYDQAPASDVRLRSTMNMGMISNLGMVSNIGGGGYAGGYGGISNLGTMSRIQRNSVTATEQRLKDMYLLDDRFDCIKETQSVLGSIIHSKRYINEPPQKDTTPPPLQFSPKKQNSYKSRYEIKVSHPKKQFLDNSNHETQKAHTDNEDYAKSPRRKINPSPIKYKSKKDEIFKAYKKKKKREAKIEDGFEPSQSSYLESSNET